MKASKIKEKKQFKHHKIFRWIALFAKLIAGPILTFAFSSLTRVVMFKEAQVTIGAMLASFCTLLIYYSIIFILNRNVNFDKKGDLKKCLAVYILVVIFLVSIETPFKSTLQNLLYKATYHTSGAIVILELDTTHLIVYLLYGLVTTLAFSLFTSHLTFNLFKKVLTKQEVLDRI